MKKKRVFIGILLCFLILCSVCEVSGNTSKNVLQTSKGNDMEAITSAEPKQTTAQRMSGDKITDVGLTPSHSLPKKSAVHTKLPAKSSLEAGGFKNGEHSAPPTHEVFKPVKLRSNGWHGKHKVSMKKFITKRAVMKGSDLELQDSSGISQANADASFLVSQAVKRGRDVALQQARMAAAHKQKDTTTKDINKLLEVAVLWKRNNRDPSHHVKTNWATGTPIESTTAESAKSDSTKPDMSANLFTVESVKPKSAGTVSKLDLNPTGSTTESHYDSDEDDTAEETINENFTGNNREESLPLKQPRMPGQEEYSQHGGTSITPEVINMNVHPKLRTTSGLRWNVALERRDVSDSDKETRHKKKKKHTKEKRHIFQSPTKIPADWDGSPSIYILGGLIGGMFLLALLPCFLKLCKYCKRRSATRRISPETETVTSSAARQAGTDDKNADNVVFEKEGTGLEMTASKQTPESPQENSNATPRNIQFANDTTDAATSGDCSFPPECSATGSPVTEVRINMEDDSDSKLPESISSNSVTSEPINCKPNELPQATPVMTRSAESLPTPKTDTTMDSDIKDGMALLPKMIQEQT